MRKLGKFILSMVIGLAMMLPTTIYAAGADKGFPDLSESHWAYQTMLWAKQREIVSGLPNGRVVPDRLVTGSEFTAMVNRAFIPGSSYEQEYSSIRVPASAAWDSRDYTFANRMNWPVSQDKRNRVITRGDVALMLTGVMGLNCTQYGAVQYMLDNGLAKGKTSSTIAGFRVNDHLTRAEAVTFIYNLYDKGIELSKRPSVPSEACAAPSSDDIMVGGITMDDTEAVVLNKLGEPQLKLASQYGFEWYVYNKDYADYVQIGIQDGEVVALLTNSNNWQSPSGLDPDSVYSDVYELYGDPLTYILKGNTRYMQPDKFEETSVYLRDDYYLTFYFDKFENNRIQAIQLIDKKVEEGLRGFFGPPSDKLRESFERQVFEFANVSRTLRGLNPLEWDDRAAQTARSHSRNMAVRGIFDHVINGRNHGDRLKSNEIEYSMAGENIAYGQKDALEVHANWMNSQGHRSNLLEKYERLGVGVYIKSDGTPYYTQNFYTPRKLLSML